MGIFYAALAKKLEMSISGVGFSVERGESIAKSANYSLVAEVTIACTGNLDTDIDIIKQV
jgi:hypothetical protein